MISTSQFGDKLAQGNLLTDFDAKLSSLNRKITSNKTKHVLVENELNKLKTFDSGYFIGKSRFEEGSSQNYLVVQVKPIYRYFKVFSVTKFLEYFSEWKSKGLSAESFKAISTSDNSPNPTLNYYGTKIRVQFTGDCLKQQKLHILMEK